MSQYSSLIEVLRYESEGTNVHGALMRDAASAVAELEAKLVEAEARLRETRIAKARKQAHSAVLMQGMAAFARAGHRDEANRWVARADEAALSVREEDLKVANLNQVARAAEPEGDPDGE